MPEEHIPNREIDDRVPGHQDSLAKPSIPAWQEDTLPEPPPFRFSILGVIGPGLVMVGSAIGGGEWLFGPAMTAKYGATLMWVATVSILFQVIYNLEVMRYTLYCGEPIFVGFFRTMPGPRFWTTFYLILDFGSIWPYLSANAAVTLVAAFIGKTPDTSGIENTYVRIVSYAVYLGAFVPLIFGGKIYYALEKVMVAKIVIVLGYLLFLGIFFVTPATWKELFLGFISFGTLPVVNDVQVTWSQLIRTAGRSDAPIDLSMVASFAAIAGVGGLNNTTLSNYIREKGWGMGKKVGAIPSFIGGMGITLSHHGKKFLVNPESLAFWKRWQRIIIRDQVGIWFIGCILGMAIPALVSLHYVRGHYRPEDVSDNTVAVMSSEAIRQQTGYGILFYTTLFCGFLALAPSQVSTIDGIVRRWTDVLWTSSGLLRKMKEDKVAYVYYTILVAFAAWGVIILTFIPKPLMLVKIGSNLMNVALGYSAFHTLVVNSILLPKELRPGLGMRVGLVACGVFFCGISAAGFPKLYADIMRIGIFGSG